MAACCAFALCACGAKGDEKGGAGGGQSESGATLIEKAGVIEAGDRTDANHGNLAYDAYELTARAFDRVRVEVATKEFSPLLKLVEVSTGAVLAEWDAEYPTGDEKALVYVIAGPGLYEARVYAMRNGKGAYTAKITVSR
jgi:hypothetical protein